MTITQQMPRTSIADRTSRPLAWPRSSRRVEHVSPRAEEPVTPSIAAKISEAGSLLFTGVLEQFLRSPMTATVKYLRDENAELHRQLNEANQRLAELAADRVAREDAEANAFDVTHAEFAKAVAEKLRERLRGVDDIDACFVSQDGTLFVVQTKSWSPELSELTAKVAGEVQDEIAPDGPWIHGRLRWKPAASWDGWTRVR